MIKTKMTMEMTFVKMENINDGNGDICPQYSLYWIQHVAMLLVPFLLNTQVLKCNKRPSINLHIGIAQGHPYTPPSKRSVSWPVFSYCVFFLFHILVLQPVAFVLHVNLDFVLCPAPRFTKHTNELT